MTPAYLPAPVGVVEWDTYGHLLPKIDAALDDALDGMYRNAVPTERAIRFNLILDQAGCEARKAHDR